MREGNTIGEPADDDIRISDYTNVLTDLSADDSLELEERKVQKKPERSKQLLFAQTSSHELSETEESSEQKMESELDTLVLEGSQVS